MKDLLNRYLNEVHELFERGDAREESFYPVLAKLIENAAQYLDKKGIDITILPKKTEGGNPDFRIWDGKARIVGYIEAKNPITDLATIEKSHQIKRYKNTFPNFILTDFLEFRFYRDGEFMDSVFIGRKDTLVNIGAKPCLENVEKFAGQMERFFTFTFAGPLNAPRLAAELAKRTRFLRDQVIIEELNNPGSAAHKYISGYYEAFNKYLVFGLSKEAFADLYSQTVTYGLFAARTRCSGEFNRKNALDFIPQTTGILHDVFEFISIGRPSKQMECIIDDISAVLAEVDVGSILNKYYRNGKGEDPVIHFYETFLSEYDPGIREKRGVYYTPEPVVSFIVRSLDFLLKDRFKRPDGLADTIVKILDPAAGTMTFIAEAAKLAIGEYTRKYGEGVKYDFVKNHLLKNFYAFEMMMAPYAIGHLKMAYILADMGTPLTGEDRFNLYLTNTLEWHDIEQTNLPGLYSLSQESLLAGKIKKETQILVILGNPPYSGISLNKGDWIKEKIETYKYVNGEYFKEKKHWLQDDYVKFIRFAQWKIDENGEGILGFITNHSYLDNPTFRGMRQSLMKSFNEIYILDLHGNTLKKEKSPGMTRDENVFDIKQGVAISLFIKKGGDNRQCKIYHADLWGLRTEKYKNLTEQDVNTIAWQELTPGTTFYFFRPVQEKHKKRYLDFIKVCDIFPINVTGIISARDKLVIDIDKKSLLHRLETFRNDAYPDDMIRQMFKLKDTRGWKLKEARQKLKSSAALEANIIKILYRPFDIRFIYYSADMVDWPRLEVMSHMKNKNLGLITNRFVNSDFKHALCTDHIINDCTVSLETKERSYFFPLYIYSDFERNGLFGKAGNQKPVPNLNPETLARINKILNNSTVNPEELFYYIYAVLYSTIYRDRYAEFLRSDFPRIPFPVDYPLFLKMVDLGKNLVELHLMTSGELNMTFAKFDKKGDNIVGQVKYDTAGNKVYINDSQYFPGVSREIWEYQVGGYQVMAKWLKDRKGRRLSLEDIHHYIKVARALQTTVEYQEKIDGLYDNIEENLP